MLGRVVLVSVAVLCTAGQALAQLDGGSDQDKYEFPKVGQIPYVVHVSSKAGICTGAIVHADWILTAAHCFFFKNKVIGQKDAKIMAGVVDYDFPSVFSKQETTSLEIRVHPRFWNHRAGKFDVALVKVRDTFMFNNWVGSINVSGEGWPQPVSHMNVELEEMDVVNETLNCMWLGFGGYMSTAPATTTLKQRNVTAGHGETACTCAVAFQWKRMICIKEQVHPLICQGDDGGPLVCNNIVRGIAHMMWNRATCDSANYPKTKCVGGPDRGLTMFMFLCPLNDWLHSIVEDIPPKPASCMAPLSLASLVLLCLLGSTAILVK